MRASRVGCSSSWKGARNTHNALAMPRSVSLMMLANTACFSSPLNCVLQVVYGNSISCTHRDGSLPGSQEPHPRQRSKALREQLCPADPRSTHTSGEPTLLKQEERTSITNVVSASSTPCLGVMLAAEAQAESTTAYTNNIFLPTWIRQHKQRSSRTSEMCASVLELSSAFHAALRCCISSKHSACNESALLVQSTSVREGSVPPGAIACIQEDSGIERACRPRLHEDTTHAIKTALSCSARPCRLS